MQYFTNTAEDHALKNAEYGFYGTYHKYWRIFRREHNPAFDTFSGKILDLKKGYNSAINEFVTILSPKLTSSFMVVTIPSHDPDNTDSPMRKLAQKLAITNHLIDGTAALERKHKICKLSYGGNRSCQTHYDSISVNKQLVQGQHILVLDDVATTGNSLTAAKKLLMDSGAAEVVCLAIAQTALE